MNRILGKIRRYPHQGCLTQIRAYVDPALVWAKEHADVAQATLMPPPLSALSLADRPPQQTQENDWNGSLENFLNVRKWKLDQVPGESRSHALAIISHVLSAPLSLASHLSLTTLTKSPSRWCCIGARAEASLPLEYWKEIMLVIDAFSDTPVDIELVFVGPECLKRPPVTLRVLTTSLTLSWPFQGKYHEFITQDPVPFDAYILLNPGIGHSHLRAEWAPTLDVLFREGKPMLFTSHSQLDAERDRSELETQYSVASVYKSNPFASRISYQDPFDERHVVRSNQYVTRIL